MEPNKSLGRGNHKGNADSSSFLHKNIVSAILRAIRGELDY